MFGPTCSQSCFQLLVAFRLVNHTEAADLDMSELAAKAMLGRVQFVVARAAWQSASLCDAIPRSQRAGQDGQVLSVKEKCPVLQVIIASW